MLQLVAGGERLNDCIGALRARLLLPGRVDWVTGEVGQGLDICRFLGMVGVQKGDVGVWRHDCSPA